MNTYIKYLKDNPKGYWFKAKQYGWGWVPVKWQGWAVTAIFVGLLLWNGFDFSENLNPTDAELTWFFIKIAILVSALIFVCYKTGEKPRWNWGVPKKDKETEKISSDLRL
jgi:hypothetical protein